MDTPRITHLGQFASSPFRALHAIVEFFAPWQKDEREGRLGAPAGALEVARHLKKMPHACAAQIVHPDAQRHGGGEHRASRPARPRNTALMAANQCAPSPSRPLRVIRAVDSQIPATSSGRMVISGRMADVCAELERLSDAAHA